MARTSQIARRWIEPRKNEESRRRMNQFELTMRKYYPKKSRFLYKDLNYQASNASNYEDANSRVLQRYKRSFFQSFDADASTQRPQPSKIPQNLKSLRVFAGSKIFLKKLVKQNKGLKHIVIESEDDKFSRRVARLLKYVKVLRSLTFKHILPYFFGTECRKMLKTWGRTIETFKSLGLLHSQYYYDCESFQAVLETVLKFPKLKRFELRHSVKDTGRYFPWYQLQERNIAYDIGFTAGSGVFESLKKKYPQFKPTGLVVIQILEHFGTLGYDRFREYSNQTLFLSRESKTSFGVSLLPVFQKIVALDLSLLGKRWDLSCMGQLNSLKHLAIHLIDDRDADIFGDLFTFLNKNVARHKKLETFMLKFKSSAEERKQELEEEPNGKAILKFFEACSDSLRTVYLEFQSPNEEFVDPEYFYEGLGKLKNLQSLALILGFGTFSSKKKVEKLCEMISEIKCLEELDFRIRKKQYQEEMFNIKFPPQLKKLTFGMDTPSVLFDVSKTLWQLSELVNLELEFSDLSSQKWKNIIQSAPDKLKFLKTVTIKSDKELKKVKIGS